MARKLVARRTGAGPDRRLSAGYLALLVLIALVAVGSSPARADATTRAVLSWSTPDTDIDVHAWTASGVELWFNNRTAIDGFTLDHDIIHGPGTETITDEHPTPDTQPLTFGVCYFTDYSRLGPAVPVTLTVNNPDGTGTRTFNLTLNAIGDERVLAVSPDGGVQFTPAAGWCRAPALGTPGAGLPPIGASPTPTPTAGVPPVPAGGVSPTTARRCTRAEGGLGARLLASLKCTAAPGVLRTRCKSSISMAPATVFRVARTGHSAASVRKKVAVKYRPVAVALYDLYHARFKSRKVAGFRRNADLVSKLRGAKKASDVMTLLPSLSKALRGSDFEKVATDLNGMTGLRSCVAGLTATVT
jgi:hypothetical protein